MFSRDDSRLKVRGGRSATRRTALAVLLLAGAVLAAAAPAAVVAQTPDPDPAGQTTQQPGFIISKTLGGPAWTVVIDTGTEESGSSELWVRSDIGVASLRLIATIEAGKVNITVDGAGEDGSFDLPPSRKITVDVSMLPKAGTFRGAIVADVGDELIPIADLSAIRRGTVTVEGSGVSEKEISASTELSTITIPLSLRSSGPESIAVRAAINQLIGSNGKDAPTTVTGLSDDATLIDVTNMFEVTVAAGQPLSFAIEAELPMVTKYSGEVRLSTSDGLADFSRPVSVTRTGDGSSSLTATKPDVVQVDDMWIPPANTTAKAKVRFAVSEGGREDVKIAGVDVVSLSRVEGDSREGVDFKAKVEPSGTFTVPLNQTREVELNISDLSATGRFEGRALLSTGSSKPLEVDFVILLRRHWLVAFLIIALGVVTASVMRHLGRQRGLLETLERSKQLGLQLAKLEETQPLTGEAADRFNLVRDHLRRRIEEVETRMQRRGTTDVEADLIALETQITTVAPGWKAVLKAVADTGVLDLAKTQIEAVEAYLTSATPDAAAKSKALQDLHAARTELGKVASLTDEIAGLRDALADHAGDLDPKTLQGLRDRLDEVAAGTDPAESRRKLDGIGRDWILELVQHALNGLPPETPRPPGYAKDEDWSADRGAAQSALTAALGMEDRAAARSAYVSAILGLIDKLRAALERAAADVITAQGQKPAEDLIKKAELVNEALRETRTGVLTKDVAEAQRAFKNAQEKYDLLAEAAASAQSRVMGPEERAPDLTAFLPDLVPGGSGGATGVDEVDVSLGSDDVLTLKRALASTRWKRFGVVLVWTTLSVIVIGLLGLLTIWVNDKTWGDVNDLIVAFVWGLGLHSGTAVVDTAVNRTTGLPGAS